MAPLPPAPLTDAERRPSRTDLAVGAAMLAIGALGLFITHDVGGEEARGLLPVWADYLALLVLIAPVPWRRMAPAVIAAAVGIGFAVFRALEVPEGPASSLAVFMVIHAAGAHEWDRRRRDVGRGLALAAGAVALVLSLVQAYDVVNVDIVIEVSFSLAINLAFYAAAWALGDLARTQRADRAELRRRAEQLALERERRARQAVLDERVRIARELHDVVAHHVSVMGVQAAAARHVLAADPSRAAQAMAQVEESGRQAVGELQRLVGVLRDTDEATVDAPQPTLAELPDLLASVEGAGVAVDLRVVGQARPLPSSVELSAYRIVQEALTNVVRHAPGASVTVVMTHLPEAVKVEVVNGPAAVGAEPAGPGGGRGLVGMRERAAMLGGTVEAGIGPRGGYRVAALLPVTPAGGATTSGAAGTAGAGDGAADPAPSEEVSS